MDSSSINIVLSALKTGAISNKRFSAITTDSAKKCYEDLKSEIQSELSPDQKSLLPSWEQEFQRTLDTQRQVPPLEIQTTHEPGQQHVEEALKTVDTSNSIVQKAKKLLRYLQPQQALMSSYSVTSGFSVRGQITSDYQHTITFADNAPQ